MVTIIIIIQVEVNMFNVGPNARLFAEIFSRQIFSWLTYTVDFIVNVSEIKWIIGVGGGRLNLMFDF